MSQRVLCLILVIATLLGATGISVSAADGHLKPNGTASTLEEMQSLVGVKSYEDYLKDWAGVALLPAGTPTKEIDVTKVAFSDFGDQNGDGVQNEKDMEVYLLKAGTFYKQDADGHPILDSENNVVVKDYFAKQLSSWGDFGVEENLENSVYLPSIGTATWNFDIARNEVGMYYIAIEYYSCYNEDESSTSSIERKFLLNTKIPFSEASYVTFNKSWEYNWDVDGVKHVDRVPVDASEYRAPVTTYNDPTARGYNVQDGYTKTVINYEWEGEQLYRVTTTYVIDADKNNNSKSPEIMQVPKWSTHYFKDASGYYTDNFQFYLREGENQFTLVAERDPVVIRSIKLVPVEEGSGAGSQTVGSYAEYAQQHSGKAAGSGEVRIEAEFPDYVSDSSVAPTNDNTSAATFPTNHSSQLYNVLGENGFSTVGQWVAYNFYVPQDGMYKISMRFLQNALQGMFVCRTVKLASDDGEYGLADGTPTVPFAEANDIKYNYSKEWQSEFLGDGNGNDFSFYFKEGVRYTIYLECSLGSLKNSIQRVEASLAVINDCYLQILQLTGADPDENRDYRFDEILPDVLYNFLVQARELATVKQDLEALCGTNGSHIATLDTVALLLLQMGSDNGDNVAKNMGTLKSYLGTLGTWINSSKQSTIMVDALFVVPATATEQPRDAEAGFWKSIWFEIKSFFASFWVDYDEMGLEEEIKDGVAKIDVWLATGRDQSQIWRSMIDAENGFTTSTGTAAALKLVTAGTLLPSILSGKGPDVYIGLAAADVINYAIRGAVLGVSGNDMNNLANPETDNLTFTANQYTYQDANGNYVTVTDKSAIPSNIPESKIFETKAHDEFFVTDGEDPLFAQAAMDTVTLLDVTYGIPETMTFAMMFYRMDVLASLGVGVPETWDDLLSCLPVIQSNNMSIGVDYISALDFMIYQYGESLWKYTDANEYDPMYAGARINFDNPVVQDSFEFVCRLYSDYSFPVTYDAANRFRTGEIPILVGGYCALYNQLVVYATEIEGLWEFCSLPGVMRDTDGDGEGDELHYESLATVTATVIVRGCDNLLASWQFAQWHTSADVQSDYGNKMVALIGPSAKYATANLRAIDNLSWTASEKLAIMDQMRNMCSIVNYPGSYIYNRYIKFAFLDAVNEGANPVEALQSYIDAINTELTRKREEFSDRGIWYVGKNDETDPTPKI